MGRTAPAPNIAPGTGMNPGVFILGGGGDGGGGAGGRGRGKGGGWGGGGAGGGDNAEGGVKNAPDYARYPECGYASHPVDVVTGRAFTHPITDLYLPGPLDLSFKRMYSSTAAGRDVGLGYGWAHSFGWEIEIERRAIKVWNEQGVSVDFPMLDPGVEVIGPWGWVLRRETWGFVVDADDGLRRHFSENENEGKRWRLTAIEDRNRNRIDLSYEEGRLCRVRDSVGRLIRVALTREGRIASLSVEIDPTTGQSITFATYTFDDSGNLIKATDAEGNSATYAYDGYHRLVLDVDRTGLAFHFVYDKQDRCIESWGDYQGKPDPSLATDLRERDPSLIDIIRKADPSFEAEGPEMLADTITPAKGVHHCRLDFGDDGYCEVADSREVRRFFGNRFGLLDKRVEGGGVITATYNDLGHIMSRTDQEEATTLFERDARGRLTRITDPLGRITIIERDANGLPLQITDPAGGETVIQRDERGNVVHYCDATGAVTSYEYDARGLVVGMVDPNGERTRITYDDDGNTTEYIQPNGAIWRWTYDRLGRVTTETDPLGACTTFRWSTRGDLLSETDASGAVTRYAYDGEGRCVEMIDPQGRATRYQWGGYNKLVQQVDPDGQAIRLRYNREGELLEIENAKGEIHMMIYKPCGLLIKERTFDGRMFEYGHDWAGRVTTIRDGHYQRTELVYDAAGQLIQRRLPDETVETFEYDLRGELVRATWPLGEITFKRDAVGRIVGERQTIVGETHTVEITLDKKGQRVRRRTSLGHVEAIERDANGARVRTLLDEDQEIAHACDLLGREILTHLPRGGRIESSYGPTGLLARRWAKSPGDRRPMRPGEPGWLGPQPDRITVEKEYRYNPSRDLTDVWDRRRGWVQYEHDACGRLVSAYVENIDRRERFSFDAAGNLMEGHGPARVYGPGGRIEQRGETRYFYNYEGRRDEKHVKRPDGGVDVWRYSWNGAGLLDAVNLPDGRRIKYAYDPFGRRLASQVSVVDLGRGRSVVEYTRYVWDADMLVHAIRVHAQEGQRAVETRTYCFDDDGFTPRAHCDRGLGRYGEPVVRWAFYVNDPIGTPEELVNAAGEVIGTLDRRAWGLTTGEGASTPLRFPGQHEDAETGLCYNRFRYYDPEIGCYISPDPIGLGGGLRLFGYTLDPTGWIDPLGLAPMMGIGPYRKVGGHHIHAQSAFRGHPNYNKYSALAIGLGEINARGWDHGKMTAKQQSCFKEIRQGIRPNTMAEHDKIAKEVLMAGNVPEDVATELVRASRRNLKNQGVHSPSRVPWSK